MIVITPMARILVGVILTTAVSGCSILGPKSLDGLPRAGFLSLDTTVNAQKPLAEGDFSGWISNDKGVLIGTYADRWVVALKAKSTSAAWWLELPDGIAGPLTVFDTQLYVSGRDGTLSQVDVATGKVNWRTKLSSFAYRKVVRNDKTVYALTAAQQLYAIDRENGNVNWIFDGGFPEGLTIGSAATPVLTSDAIIIGLAKGDLVAVNLTSGKEIWRYANESTNGRFHDVNTSVLVKGDRLYMTRYDGFISCLEISASSVRKIWDQQSSSVTAALLNGNQFITASHSGELQSFDTTSGRRLWRNDVGVTSTALYAK